VAAWHSAVGIIGMQEMYPKGCSQIGARETPWKKTRPSPWWNHVISFKNYDQKREITKYKTL